MKRREPGVNDLIISDQTAGKHNAPIIYIQYKFYFVFSRGIVPITCDELFKAMNNSAGDIVSASSM